MIKKEQFIPDNIRHYLKNLCHKSVGIFFIFTSLYLTLSLFFYSPMDNSLLTSSTFPTSNITGTYGAHFANLMYYFLGVGSFLLTYHLFILGRYFFHKNFLNYPMKKIIMYTIISITLLCLNLSYTSDLILPVFPTTSGLGGLVGYIIKSDIKTLLNILHITPYMQIIIAIITTLINFITLYFALNLTPKTIIRLETFIRNIYLNSCNFIKWKILKKHQEISDTKVNITPQKSKIIKVINKFSYSKKITTSNTIKTEEKIIKAVIKKSNYILPSLELLHFPKIDKAIILNEEINYKKAKMLENILSEFGIDGKISNIKTGPVITLFEMEPGRGIKTSRITSLSEDIARDMSALSARVAVIAGTNRIGIELPNTHRKMVYLRGQLQDTNFENTEHILPISLGNDTSGSPVFVDLAKMPHLLIAGTTGSGKSVGVNGMILSLLYKFTPEECKFIMIDPKMLEFSVYNDIPHLLIPVVIDPVKAVAALKWAVREMEERNRNMSALGAKNIESYNKKAKIMDGEFITREVQTGFDPQTGEPTMEEKKIEIKPIPYIVVIVDEMADLMLVAGKEVEAAIARLAAMARAAGIHLILSTQRPSVDVITGTIKSNFPNRISYRVASKIDSRTIINEQGAELMLGKGDMLYMAMGGSLIRIHGAFVSEEEIEQVVSFVKGQAKPNYVKSITSEKPSSDSALSLLDKTVFNNTKESESDNLYIQAVQIILSAERPSISYLQRQLGIGYNKSANLIEKMQANGILSAPDSTGKRTILAKKD